MIKIISISASLLLSLSALANESTISISSDPSVTNRFSDAEKYEEQINCAMKAAGAKSSKQIERVEYVAKSLGPVFAQMSPELKSNFIRHMLAQGAAETGNLEKIEEGASKHASSKKEHKGRGLIQTTHKDNYAKLAGCEKVTQETPPPSIIDQNQIAQAPKLASSDIVANPASVVSEKNDRGKKLLALGSLCYFLETEARHPEFAKALEGTSDSAVNKVGLAVNRGPGSISKGGEPLDADKRLKAYKNMGSCFDSQIGI